jgi:hypothetical protein
MGIIITGPEIPREGGTMSENQKRVTRRICREWLDATEAAIRALESWRMDLQDWRINGGEWEDRDFDKALIRLTTAGLGLWADQCKAGGGIDALARAVEGER